MGMEKRVHVRGQIVPGHLDLHRADPTGIAVQQQQIIALVFRRKPKRYVGKLSLDERTDKELTSVDGVIGLHLLGAAFGAGYPRVLPREKGPPSPR